MGSALAREPFVKLNAMYATNHLSQNNNLGDLRDSDGAN